YNEALIPIFLFMIPAGLIAALLLSFVKEKKLATTIDRDEPFEEGDDEVDEDAEDAENSESSGRSRNPDSTAETVAAKKQPGLTESGPSGVTFVASSATHVISVDAGPHPGYECRARCDKRHIWNCRPAPL